MAIDKLNPKLINVTGASNGDALVYRSSNGQVEFGSVAVDTSGIVHGMTGANTNITTNSGSITANKTISDTFGTYANSTFASDTNLNTVSSKNVNLILPFAVSIASICMTSTPRSVARTSPLSRTIPPLPLCSVMSPMLSANAKLETSKLVASIFLLNINCRVF